MRNKLLVASALSAVFALVCSDSAAMNRLGGRQVGPQQNQPSVQVSPERQEAERRIEEKFNRIDPYKDDPSKNFINRYRKREGSYDRLVDFFIKNPGEPEREVVVRKIFDGSTERTLEKFNRVLHEVDDNEYLRELSDNLIWIKGKSSKAEEKIRAALRVPFDKRNEIVQLIQFINPAKDVGNQGNAFAEITVDVYGKLLNNTRGGGHDAVGITEPFEKFKEKMAKSVPLDNDEGGNNVKWTGIFEGNRECFHLIPTKDLSEGLDILVESLLYPYEEAMKVALQDACLRGRIQGE